MRNVPDLLVFGLGGGSGRGPSPTSPQPTIRGFSVLLQPIRCGGSTRGGAFFTCLFWALCHSLLSHPNYIISTVAKVGICRRSSAASSAMFTAVWSFFWRLLKKIHWSIPFATPVTRLPDHNKNPRGPRVAQGFRRSKPEARLNAVQRRNRQQRLTSHRCRMLASKPDSKRPRCKDKVLSSGRYFTVGGSPFALEDRRLPLRYRRRSP